jgi:hypothetical protein
MSYCSYSLLSVAMLYSLYRDKTLHDKPKHTHTYVTLEELIEHGAAAS